MCIRDRLGLLEIGYQGLAACCADEAEWQSRHPLLGSIPPERRCELVRDLLEHMRRALCIKTIYLDSAHQERIRNRSFNELKEPWGFTEDEKLSPCQHMVPRPRSSRRLRLLHVYNVSHLSAFGRKVKSTQYWGRSNPHYPQKPNERFYNALKHLIGTDLDDSTKKLLAFTDNRQDASLQAGHFNDFIQILLLRGALLAAMQSAGGRPLTDETLAQHVYNHLRLQPQDYAANPLSLIHISEPTRPY